MDSGRGDDHRVQSGNRGLIGRTVEWVRRHPELVGFAIFGVFGVYGLVVATNAGNDAQDAADHAEQLAHENMQAIRDIETERTVRTRAVNGVIFLGCTRDNKQDLLLAGLIAGSIKAGANRQLTPSQQRLLQVYEGKVADLRHIPKCATVVRAFLRAANENPQIGAAPIPGKQATPQAGGSG